MAAKSEVRQRQLEAATTAQEELVVPEQLTQRDEEGLISDTPAGEETHQEETEGDVTDVPKTEEADAGPGRGTTSIRRGKYHLLEEEEILAMELISQRPPLWLSLIHI